MVSAPWTYELPPAGSFDENLDEYEARTADGEHAGLVTGLVERDGELYVLVDAGRLPPFLHRRLAVPWDDVTRVDHDALVVDLAVEHDRLDEVALALDPRLARHEGEAVEAARVRDLPPGFATSVAAGSEGPVDRPSAFVALAAATLSAYALLVIVALWSARGLSGLEYAAFAAPLVLALFALAVGGYRLYREPHVGRHAAVTPGA